MSEYDFTEVLSLDTASVTQRNSTSSLNEAVLRVRYNGVPKGAKEDAVSWLETNRQSITDASINFQSFSGVWYSFAIAYDDSAVEQFFSQSASYEEVRSQAFASREITRWYYYGVADPATHSISDYDTPGVSWTKEVQSLSSGTFNVVLQRTINKKLDTGWQTLPSARGEIKVRTTNNLTELEKDAMLGEVDDSTNNTLYISKNDSGLWDVTIIRNPITWTFSVKPEGYNTYNETSATFRVTQEYQSGGEVKTRQANAQMRVAGGSAGHVLGHISPSNLNIHKIQFNPNGDGSYFQGQSVVLTGSWADV